MKQIKCRFTKRLVHPFLRPFHLKVFIIGLLLEGFNASDRRPLILQRPCILRTTHPTIRSAIGPSREQLGSLVIKSVTVKHVVGW